MATTVEELEQLGLLEGPERSLTDRGRDVLRLLGQIDRAWADPSAQDDDLVLATNALIR